MGRASRRKAERRKLRQAFGTDELPQSVRRQFDSDIQSRELWPSIVDELCQYERLSVIESLCDVEGPEFAINRVLRLLSRSNESEGAKPISNRAAEGLVRRSANVWNERLPQMMAAGTLNRWAISALLAEQLPVQRDHHQSIHRIGHVFLDDDSDAISPAAWYDLLGCTLPGFVLSAMTLAQAFRDSAGPFSWGQFLADLNGGAASIEFIATKDLLSMSFEDLREPAGDDLDWLSQKPLIETPIINLDDGRICAPAPSYVDLAWSPAALYIRLLRADSGKRTRSKAIGDRFGQYMVRYAESVEARDWQVVDLDTNVAAGTEDEIADVLFIAPHQKFVIIVEAKATLSTSSAQAGQPAATERMMRLYEKAFSQIEATQNRFGKYGPLAFLPPDTPTFGVVVTLDLHQTTVRNEQTFLGYPLTFGDLGSSVASPPHSKVRIWNIDELEILIDLARSSPVEDVEKVLEEAFGSEDSIHPVKSALASTGLATDELPINPMIRSGFEKFVNQLPWELAQMAQPLIDLG